MNANFCKEIPAILVTARSAKKWTQYELALASKVSVQTISRLEQGSCNVSIMILQRIFKALGIVFTARIEFSNCTLNYGLK